uniref:Uncharacterized protein n=1 Tax=Rhizophora mucronata TaxID=61149 RepID=A0A2P2QMT2_RHIMU
MISGIKNSLSVISNKDHNKTKEDKNEFSKFHDIRQVLNNLY